MREFKQNIIAFGIFCASLLIILLINSYISITGNIIWDDINTDNCSNTSIKALWDSVFDISDNDITILKNISEGGNCEEYLAYKNDSSGQFWEISGEIFNDSWNTSHKYYEDERILNYYSLNILYTNTTTEFITDFYVKNDIDSKINLLYTLAEPENYNNITNWSIETIIELNNTLETIYETAEFENIPWGNDSYSFFYSDYTLNNTRYNKSNHFTLKNESFTINEYVVQTYDSSFIVNFTKNISNYYFEPGSNWTFAFNITTHFNISDESVFIVDYGNNNSNGEWINCSINDINASFLPNGNFTGTRKFKFTATNPSETGEDAVSNYFNVTFNTKPEQISDIDDIYLSDDDAINIDLSNYFEDADEDDLIYTLDDETDDINVTFNGDIMTIGLKENFTTRERFKINVFDGFENISSNSISVWINETINATSPDEDDGAGEEDDGVNEEDVDVDEEDNAVNEEDVEEVEVEEIKDEESNRVGLIIAIVIIILATIAIVIIMIKIGKNSKSKIKRNIPKNLNKPTFTTSYNKPNPNINKPTLQQRVPVRRRINPNLRNNIVGNYNRNLQNNSNQFRR